MTINGHVPMMLFSPEAVGSGSADDGEGAKETAGPETKTPAWMAQLPDAYKNNKQLSQFASLGEAVGKLDALLADL